MCGVWGEKKKKKGAAQQGEQTSSDVEETDRAPRRDIPAVALLKQNICNCWLQE